MSSRSLLVLGFGYSAERIPALLLDAGWRVTGTTRSPDRIAEIEATGARGVLFREYAGLRDALRDVTDLLVSIPPDRGGGAESVSAGDARDSGTGRSEADAGLRLLSAMSDVETPSLRTVAYLSTTGVYGDHGGEWVHETTPPAPGLDRTHRRLAAEDAWAALASDRGLRSLTFRISGIYGPGRSAIDALRSGSARRILKPGSVSNRVHVEDIARSVVAALNSTEHGVFNLSDDLPASNDEVMLYAASLIGVEPPEAISWDDPRLSPMARSFFQEDRRVGNGRLSRDLGISLRHPTYREGLAALAGRSAP